MAEALAVRELSRKMAAAAELRLLEKWLGLSQGNKYGAHGERQIPVLQTNSGPSLTGLTTIAAHLVRQANKEHLLGSTAEEKAVVQQWLEYRVTRVDGHSTKEDTHTLLKDLNSYLEDKVYLAGYNLTLADILLYYGLHHFIPMLTSLFVGESVFLSLKLVRPEEINQPCTSAKAHVKPQRK